MISTTDTTLMVPGPLEKNGLHDFCNQELDSSSTDSRQVRFTWSVCRENFGNRQCKRTGRGCCRHNVFERLPERLLHVEHHIFNKRLIEKRLFKRFACDALLSSAIPCKLWHQFFFFCLHLHQQQCAKCMHFIFDGHTLTFFYVFCMLRLISRLLLSIRA